MNQIISHDNKIELMKEWLKNNDYTEIIVTHSDFKMGYPVPDLIAKTKEGKEVAVECGGLSKQTKIDDLLKKYDLIIHLFEKNGMLFYITYLPNKIGETPASEKLRIENERLNKELFELGKKMLVLEVEKEQAEKWKDKGYEKYHELKTMLNQFIDILNNSRYEEKRIDKLKNIFAGFDYEK